MNKTNSNQQDIVHQFIDFMKSSNFELHYNLMVSYFHRKQSKSFIFNNLYDGFINYEWNGKKYDDTKIELDEYCSKLKTAFFTEDNKILFIHECKEILKWGKVDNKHTLAKLTGDNFYQFVKELNSAWNSNDNLSDTLSIMELRFKNNKENIFSNAGFTKIYSLLFENWVIYDSRVAAGLQYLILLFLEKNGEEYIPIELNIASPLSRGGKDGDYRKISSFKTIYSNPYLHLESNIKANYILNKYFENNTNTKFEGADRMRQLEAALFMIGYDLSKQAEGLNNKLNLIKKNSL